MNTNAKLPLEHPPGTAFMIYAKRLIAVLGIALINAILIGYVLPIRTYPTYSLIIEFSLLVGVGIALLLHQSIQKAQILSGRSKMDPLQALESGRAYKLEKPDGVTSVDVPIRLPDSTIGALNLLRGSPKHDLGPEEMDFINVAANRIILSLENARLISETTQEAEKAREIDRLKSSYLSAVAYEMRVPLNSILGFSDAVLHEIDGEISAPAIDNLMRVQKNARRLLNLVNDIIDLDKIEAGKLVLSLEKVNLEDVIRETVELFESTIHGKTLDLGVKIDASGPLDVFADRQRLRQIMANLLSNAIKYTDKGNIKINAVREGPMVRVNVRDTSVGFPSNRLKDVYDAFATVDQPYLRNVTGTGLGFHVAQQLIKLHGGEITVEAREGKGTTISILLPIEKSDRELVRLSSNPNDKMD